MLIACMPMIASCAGSRPGSPVAPPRLDLPEAALRPCVLPTLPPEPTRSDLEIAYAARGAEIVSCDGARRLAVETLLAERTVQDALASKRPKASPLGRFWSRLTRQE